MPRPRHLRAGLVVVGCVVVALLGWIAFESVGEDGVELVALTDPLGESMKSPDSAYVSFHLFPVCLSARGEVTIRAIEPLQTNGAVSITDFSTTTYQRVGTNSSIATARIRDRPYLQGPKTVRAECLTGQPNDTELVVEVHVPDAEGQGFVEGFRILYSDGTRDKEVDVPVTIGACRASGGCASYDLRAPDLPPR